MLEIPRRQPEVMNQGGRGDQGIRKAGVVVPSNLTPAPCNGKIEVNVREQGQQLLDLCLFFLLPHLSRRQFRDGDDREISLHLPRLKAFEILPGWLIPAQVINQNIAIEEDLRVCPTFYIHNAPTISGPFSRKSAMSRERYFIA